MRIASCLAVSLVLGLASCAPAGRTPTEGKTKKIEIPLTKGWEAPSDAVEWPAPGEALLDSGFMQTLPTKPRALYTPLYMPWTTGRAIAVHDGEIFAVDTENDLLTVLDAQSGKIQRSIAVGARPEHVVVDARGNAFVTVRHGAEVVRISAHSRTVSLRSQIGTEPFGLALSPDQTHLYVALRADGALVTLDADTLDERGRLEDLDRPTVVAVSADFQVAVAEAGNTIIIVNTGSDGLPIALTRQLRHLRRALPWDSLFHPQRSQFVKANRVRGMVFSPEDGTILATHPQAFTGSAQDVLAGVFDQMMNGIDVETPNGPGSTGVNPGYGGATKSTTPHLLRPMVTAVTRLNPKGNIEQQEAGPNASTGTAPVKDALSLEPLTHLLAQASDINHHPTWSLALVTGMGSDNVLVLNTADSDPMTSPLGILEVGQGPKAVTFSDDGKIAYVLNAHSFTVSQVDLSPFFSMPDADGLPVGLGVKDAFQKPQKVYEKTDPIRLKHKTWARFGQDKLDDEMRLGRRLFTFVRNESISHGGRFTCNSCHYEGGEDHLVWFVPGGLRQTPQLAQRLAGTGPFNWAGTEGELQDNMSETIERMGGEGFSPKELEALEKYMLYGLVSPPNPYAGDETLADAQARGKAIFNDPIVACANCHLGEGFTDGKNHDVGTASEIELEFLEMAKMFGKEFNTELDLPEKITFNTPTLRDLHATAPYLHDGSAATLKEALIKTANSMGNTAHLSTGQMDDLVAYLLTL